MPLPDIYTSPDGDLRREAYRTYIRASLIAAGFKTERAAAIASTVLTIETALFAGKLTPLEASDPRNTYNPMNFARISKKVPELDLNSALASLAITPPESIVLTQSRYLEALSRVLRDQRSFGYQGLCNMGLDTEVRISFAFFVRGAGPIAKPGIGRYLGASAAP